MTSDRLTEDERDSVREALELASYWHKQGAADVIQTAAAGHAFINCAPLLIKLFEAPPPQPARTSNAPLTEDEIADTLGKLLDTAEVPVPAPAPPLTQDVLDQFTAFTKRAGDGKLTASTVGWEAHRIQETLSKVANFLTNPQPSPTPLNPQSLSELTPLAIVGHLIDSLKDHKPVERSAMSRRYAIAVTEAEKLQAYIGFALEVES